MLIAWQTINAVRRPGSKHFTRGFLVVAPGLTIKDRLRVLQPNDPDSYYASRELVPSDMLDDIERAKIVITNYHAFKLRERIELSKGGRSLLQGRGEELNTLETEGQMLQRVMPDLMGMKNILVLNDEAHHCYREKPRSGRRGRSEGRREEGSREEQRGRPALDFRPGSRQAQARRRAASSTSRRRRSSSAAPATPKARCFPWTMSDFSLMDAIECGIVKLPRVPVADNIPGDEMPMFRNLWEHIRNGHAEEGPRQGRRRSTRSSSRRSLQTALEALYGHYEKTFELWARRGHHACRPASSSSATTRPSRSWSTTTSPASTARTKTAPTTLENGRLALFRNFDEHGNPLAAPEHAADRQRAARIRRCAGRQFPRHGGRRDRALPPRDHRAHRRPRSRPRTSPTRNCSAK